MVIFIFHLQILHYLCVCQQAFLCVFVVLVTARGGSLVPTPWQSLIEMIYEFVVSLVSEQVGEKGKQYFPILFTLFTFLLCSNLIGMIPYSFTTTSHLL